jgi:hypothetical protein
LRLRPGIRQRFTFPSVLLLAEFRSDILAMRGLPRSRRAALDSRRLSGKSLEIIAVTQLSDYMSIYRKIAGEN